MQLALYGSIAWRHPLGIGQVVDWAKRFGWDYVDARGLSLDVPGELDRRINAFGYEMLGPRQIQGSARRALRERFEEAGVPLLCIYCSSSVNLPGESGNCYRQLFRDFLQLAADLGATWVRPINNTVRTWDDDPDRTPEDAWAATIDGYRDVARTAAELGVGLLFENNERTVPSNADGLLELKETIGEVCKTGIAYDAVNAYFQGLDPQAELEKLAGQIDVLHVKNVRRHDSAQWNYLPKGEVSYEWMPLSEGDIDWPAIIKQAVDGGFDGPLTWEYVNPFKGMPPEYWDSLREPEEAARIEGEFLRGIVDSLSK
jgi:sugar phosphate isomerase/epimerase